MFDHKLLGGVAVVAMACATAHAQQTTASLRGSITDTNGSGLSNASVVVLHEPTGTSSSVETSGNGTFSISNLRVGGPFTVTVTRDGYEAAVLENIFFVPGQQDPLRVELFSSDEDVVVVRAERNGVIGIDNGVGSSFSADQLQSQPSFGRDFSDILARDPLVNSNGNGNLNIAGINSNLNSLTVNGVAVQEEFGINSSGIFATQRPPIDLNAIESVSVSVADFSVLSSGFQGGLVNVVTKSGTNEFDGIVEYTWTDGDLAGDRAFDRDVDLGDFEEEELSISLGGPIIKDKLFFFVNYSDFERTSPGFPNFGDTDPALFGVLRDIAQDVYGFDPGDRFAINAGNQTTERFLGKLDWNINDDHRAALTYQKVEEFEIGSFGTFDFPTAARSEPLDNEAYTFELFSNWTENFSTTFRYATRESDFGRTPLGGVGGGLAGSTLPQIRVTVDQNDPFFAANGLDGTALVGTSPVRFDVGTAFFDQANAIEDELETIYLQGDYTLGDHTITAGFQREEYSVFNAFIPGSAGDVTFDTISDFENQFASEASLQLPASGIVADGVTNLDYELYSFFVQDSWSITPSFELTAGLRYERFEDNDTAPARLDQILESGERRTFEELYGFAGDASLDGADIWLPRIGFNWSVTDRLDLKGGFGIYAGGNPQVLFANQFVPQLFTGEVEDFANIDLLSLPQDLTDQIAQNAADVNGRFVPSFGVFPDDYDLPAQRRFALIADYDLNLDRWNLGDNYQVTFQFLRSEAQNAQFFQNLTFLRDDLPAVGVAPDGRPIYPNLNELNESAAILLSSTDEGFSNNFTVQLAKRYDNGLSFDFSYNYQDVEEVAPLSSSRAISQFRAQPGPDRNNPTPAVGSNEIEHSFKIFVQYEKEFFRDLETQVSLFGQIQSGRPFSYGVRSFNHLFGVAGDGEFPFGNNDPLYIPLLNADGTGFNDPIVRFASAAAEQDLLTFVNTRGLEGFAGQILPRDAERAPWTRRWDLSFEQELPGIPGAEKYIGDNNLKFTVDIFNVLNLLNDDWGQLTRGPSFNGETAVRADLIDVNTGATLEGARNEPICGVSTECVYEYQFLETDPEGGDVFFDDLDDSVWQVRFGIRYEF